MVVEPLPERLEPLVRPSNCLSHPWDFRCPVCGVWGLIDQEQYEGRVSIDHTQFEDRVEPTGCTFHETIDCRNIEHLPSPG